MTTTPRLRPVRRTPHARLRHDEVRALADEAAAPPVLTAPRALPDLLAGLAAGGHPDEPLELDV